MGIGDALINLATRLAHIKVLVAKNLSIAVYASAQKNAQHVLMVIAVRPPVMLMG